MARSSALGVRGPGCQQVCRLSATNTPSVRRLATPSASSPSRLRHCDSATIRGRRRSRPRPLCHADRACPAWRARARTPDGSPLMIRAMSRNAPSWPVPAAAARAGKKDLQYAANAEPRGPRVSKPRDVAGRASCLLRSARWPKKAQSPHGPSPPLRRAAGLYMGGRNGDGRL